MTYTSPNTSGSLSFTPVANASGTATISVTVTNNGGTANGGVATVTQAFTVTVLPVNQAPTLTAIATPAAILENTFTPQVIPLPASAAGPGNGGESLTVSAVSSNPGLIPNPSINYTSPNATGTLTYAPLPDVSGQAIILVTVMNSGGTANGGINTLTRTFTVTVTPVNQAPTLNPIQDSPPVFENSINAQSPATIALSGITDGPGDTGQVLSVSAVSTNPALVPNPSVVYTNPNTTGTLLYSLAPNASGKATITVTVTDDGGTTNGGVNTFSRNVQRRRPADQPGADPGPDRHPEPDQRELGRRDDQPQRHHRGSGRHAGPGHRDHEPHAGDHRHPHGQLHQPERDRHAHHRAAGLRHRHGDVPCQRDGQRRHRQRRRERLRPAARHGGGQRRSTSRPISTRSPASRSPRTRRRRRPRRALPAVRSARSI